MHIFVYKVSYNEKLLNLEWDKPPTFAGYDNPNFDVQLESFSQSKTIVHGKLKEIFNFKVNESKFKCYFRLFASRGKIRIGGELEFRDN